jgi:ribonuclease Z
VNNFGRQKIAILATVLAVLVFTGYSNRASLVETLFKAALPQQLGANRVLALEDGLHVALCGAGGPFPAPRASGPCVAVVAGDQFFIVDTGTDGSRNLGRMGYPASQVAAVFLTHFHSDHIDGLGELATARWATGDHKLPLPVYGPEGVTRVVDGFNAAYAQDFIYRHEHHGDQVAPLSAAGISAMPFKAPPEGAMITVFDNAGVVIKALRVDHAPVSPAVGYHFSYGQRTALITGDTAQSDNVKHFAQGVDLLVHEALAPNLMNMMRDAANQLGNQILSKIFFDVLDYHASPAEAAETARDAGVGHLLYYHVTPPIALPGQEALWLNGAEAIFPDYTVGYDGVSFSLPANSAEIIQTSTGL